MPDITAWLGEIGLGQYVKAFLENDIDLEIISELTEADLEKLGLSLGHRKKFLRAVASLLTPSTVEVPPGKGTEVAGAAPSVTARPDAQRRQLTVVFCDLVGSTALSSKIDPEEMRDVLLSYQNAVARQIARFDGHVAKFMGDGVLAYFGWPRAHEDDAERAVLAGLATIAAMGHLRTPVAVGLAVRVGIATGLVVVGDLIGEGAAQEEAVVGETPNLAARLQGVAEPNTVVVSETTRRLIGDIFELQDLGQQNLKGIDPSTRAFRVVRELRAESRFDARHGGAQLPMVGRDHELGLLLDRWRQSAAGDGQVILLTGEAGIGKSRVTRALSDALAEEPYIRVRWQCSPYHSESVLYPAIQYFGAAAAFAQSDTADQRLDKLEVLLKRAARYVQDVLPLVATMLSLPIDRYSTSTFTPQQLRARTLQALVNSLLDLARRKPVLFILEDLHWVDPTTLEFLSLLVDALNGKPVMALVTTRPFIVPSLGQSHVTRLTLNRLAREPAKAIIERLTGGKVLPQEVMRQILERTDGMPLFVEELTKTVLESGLLKESNGVFVLTGPLPPLAIPSSLHDSLMARLDRLAPIKEVAQTAAVIGREFSYALLASLSPLSEEDLQAALTKLADAELVHRRGVPPDATYVFKHALVRDAAYGTLLKSSRHLLHAHVAKCLETKFPETQPEVIARHAEEALLYDKALEYWLQAGERDRKRSANVEAIAHLSRCLEILTGLPDRDDRIRQELTIQLALANALMACRGYAAPELGTVYARARELAERTNETSKLLPVLYGLWAFKMVSGRHAAALEISHEFVELARATGDISLMVATRAVGLSSNCLGQLASAERCCSEVEVLANTLFDRIKHRDALFTYGTDPEVSSLAYGSLPTWLLGYPDRALKRSEKAIALANQSSHQHTLAYALAMGASLQMMHRDAVASQNRAEAMVALTTEVDIPFWRAWALTPLGWALAQQGRIDEGIARVRDGLKLCRATGALMGFPTSLTVLAELQWKAGQLEEAQATLEEALAMTKETEETYWAPETHRIRGEVLLTYCDDPKDAETNFHEAMRIARQQGSRMFELRSAVSLARVWLAQGKPTEAYDLLTPLYDVFTEGFESCDLLSAKAVLTSIGFPLSTSAST
jgi:class 3 adenylate cyclase/predicted ATPase